MPERERIQLPAEQCPYCKDAVERSDPGKVACNGCMAWHHAECWKEHGACSACGATATGLASPLAPSQPRAPGLRQANPETDRFVARLVALMLPAPVAFLCGLLLFEHLELAVHGLPEWGEVAGWSFLTAICVGLFVALWRVGGGEASPSAASSAPNTNKPPHAE